MALTFPIDDETYHGPLHLLLALAERGEVDLRRLSLSRLTERYLAAVRQMDVLPIEEVGEFLFMGARLVRLKLEEERLGEAPEEALDLESELRILGALQEAAAFLRAHGGGRSFTRPESAPPGTSSADDLLPALERLFRRRRRLAPPAERTVRRQGVSVDEIVADLWRSLAGGPRPLTIPAWPWGRRGMTLFAALELARTQRARLIQEEPFGEIIMEKVDAAP